jgi:formylglycine-generating enzyme required for sulfatase activity/serine/threonine protein kinase
MPTVLVQCPRCARSYSIDGSLVGRRARCKGCGHPFALTPSVDLAGPDTGSSDDLFPGGWSADAPLPETVARFLIRQRLGSGAFGAVYRATDPTLDRDVAVKVPHPEYLRDDRAVARFLREAKAAARLRHPHIIPVFEAGSDGSTSYIATAFIPGRTLAEALDDGAFDPRRAARIAAALADALHHAHGQGIVHRDVKPANVLLDDEDRPHLTDFGLAHLAASSVRLTAAGSILGTPAYLSPEQAAGHSDEAHPSSDQYSLGVTLYQLLCGRTPFAGPLEVVIFHTLHSPPPPPRSVVAGVPAELEAICLKVLSKRPEDRYASCRELAKDLGRWLAGRPTSLAMPAPLAATVAEPAAVAPAPTGPPSLPVTIAEEPLRLRPPSLPAGHRPWHDRRIMGPALAALVLLLLGAVIYAARMSATARPGERSGTGVASTPHPTGTNDPAGTHPPADPASGAATTDPPGARLAEAIPPTNPARSPSPSGPISNSIGMTLNVVPAGSFQMGSDDEEDSRPIHPVRITRPFYLSIHEVTLGQYLRVMGTPPSQDQALTSPSDQDRHPAAGCTWLDAVTFCNKLSLKENLTPYYDIRGSEADIHGGDGYRLPTEAEWEYACRAGHPGRYAFGDDPAELGQYAWYWDNSEERGLRSPHPVGQKRPNGLGLYDMHGNVGEWCWDLYDSEFYRKSPVDDPSRTGEGDFRVVRGGSFLGGPETLRVACRKRPGLYVGIRIARDAPGDRSEAGRVGGTADDPGSPRPPVDGPSPDGPGTLALYTRGDPLKQNWEMYGYGTIKEEAEGSGVLVTSGGMGLLCYTGRPFQDFILKMEYQVSSPQDHSGVYVGIPRVPITPTEAAAGAYSIQIWDNGQNSRGTGAIWGLKARDLQAPFRRPGEWNELGIHVEGGEIRVFVGGRLINTHQISGLRQGYIGLQNLKTSDGSGADSSVRFRNIRIEPLDRAASPSFGPGRKYFIANAVPIRLFLVPAGEFLMGSPESDPEAGADEKPQHRVRIGAFYLGLTEVTRGQFRRFVEQTGYRTDAEKDGKGLGWDADAQRFVASSRYTWRNPGFLQTDDHPVVNVSWNDAVSFCDWLSKSEGRTYRLPTEAEWEYACRAGTKTRYSSGDDPERLVTAGNIWDATARAKYTRSVSTFSGAVIKGSDGHVHTAPTGQFRPNAFGLYDMHGNVEEWCLDGYDARYYQRSPVQDPPGAMGALPRVISGGSWDRGPGAARSAKRNSALHSFRSAATGFRVALIPPER